MINRKVKAGTHSWVTTRHVHSAHFPISLGCYGLICLLLSSRLFSGPSSLGFGLVWPSLVYAELLSSWTSAQHSRMHFVETLLYHQGKAGGRKKSILLCLFLLPHLYPMDKKSPVDDIMDFQWPDSHLTIKSNRNDPQNFLRGVGVDWSWGWCREGGSRSKPHQV